MNKPLVSVVIPLFNKQNYITGTLRSVIAQDYENIEIVLLDDGSTDNSYEMALLVLKNNQARFKRVLTISRENRGMTRTKNEGIELGIGSYIAFLDADDLWHPSKISRQVDFLEKHPDIDLVLCNYVMLYQHKSRCVNFTPVKCKVSHWLRLTGYGGLLESTGLAKKSKLIEFGGFNSNLEMFAALDMAYVLSQQNRIGCVPEYLCGYRVLFSGWHNNKQDLVNSFKYLQLGLSTYFPVIREIGINLEIYLSLWRVRTQKTLKSWLGLLFVTQKHPFFTIKFLVLTFRRVCIAQFNTVVNWRKVREIRELALK
jgi:glycosyltransferase involved in cell wall biosynthesis